MSRSILSPKLTLNTSNSFYSDIEEESDWAFCKDTLRCYFEIPEGVKQIQFRAFNEPGPGRTKIKLEHYGDDKVLWSGVFIDGKKELREYVVEETQDAIKKLAGRRKIWYVDVYYWEQN